MQDAPPPGGRWPPWLVQARASWLLEFLGYEAALASGVAGAVGLVARHTPWPWAAVAVPEQAGWVVLPAVSGLLLAGVARCVWRGASPRPLLACSLVALAVAGWPLALLPATTSRFHQAMRQTLGAPYPDGLPALPGGTMRPTPLSVRDFIAGIPVGQPRGEPDLVYRTMEGRPLALDLYEPPTAGLHPVVVVIHGGGWRAGDRREAVPLNLYLAARGYAAAAIDYRLAPAAPYPAALDDVRAAVAYLAAHAAEHALDLSRVVLLGRSAGGHLALLAGYTTDAETLGGARVVGIVAYYAPTDLEALAHVAPESVSLDLRQLTQEFVGADADAEPARFARASPITFADAPVPPTLLIHGARDEIVPVVQSRRLAARLTAAGNPVAYLELPWSAHGFDAAFNGLGSQLVLYEQDRFLAWAVGPPPHD
jgi:acetyl esterase/lipase